MAKRKEEITGVSEVETEVVQDVVEEIEEIDEEHERLILNLRFYERGRAVPADALKEIRAGRLKGMSDVNPMWRMKRLTEIFGPCGFGWRYTIDKQWTETYGAEVKCFCNVSLYVRDPETKEWSAAIPGNGGSAIVSKEKSGTYVNDEGYKMALTDALSIAMKPLGIGADIWYGEKATGHNESKYEQYTQPDVQQSQQPQQVQQAQPAQQQPRPIQLTQEVINNAVAEIKGVRSKEEFFTVWNKWSGIAPTLCIQGSPFFNAAQAAHTKLNSVKQ